MGRGYADVEDDGEYDIDAACLCPLPSACSLEGPSAITFGSYVRTTRRLASGVLCWLSREAELDDVLIIPHVLVSKYQPAISDHVPRERRLRGVKAASGGHGAESMGHGGRDEEGCSNGRVPHSIEVNIWPQSERLPEYWPFCPLT